MTITELRKEIHVVNYFCVDHIASIKYIHKKEYKYLNIPRHQLYEELMAMGAIDNEEEFEDYNLNQWDAINMAIRNEYNLSLQKELDNF